MIEFVQHSRAWYRASSPLAEGVVDDVCIIMTASDDVHASEMMIAWHSMRSAPWRGPEVWPRVECFGDGIRCLGRVLPAIGHLIQSDATPEQVCEALLAMGAVDTTPTEPSR